MWTLFFYIMVFPGFPFAFAARRLGLTGDNDNESETIAFLIWAGVFGILVWAGLVFGGIWMWKHLSILYIR
jgi:hypothetical protein